MSTVQIRVIRNQAKTTIAIHKEKLLNAEKRTAIKEYWTKIIEKLTKEIECRQVTKAIPNKGFSVKLNDNANNENE